MPHTLDRDDAMHLAGILADETRAVLHAETFIAERRYRQMLAAADAYKLVLLKARRRYERAMKDGGWLVKFADETTGFPNRASPSSLGLSEHPLVKSTLRKPAGNTNLSYYQLKYTNVGGPRLRTYRRRILPHFYSNPSCRCTRRLLPLNHHHYINTECLK